jgi:hypothetical protein
MTRTFFRLLFLGFLFTAIQLKPVSARAAGPNEDVKSVFMSTETIQTSEGPAHMEVQSFDVSTPENLAEARRQIEKDITAKPKTRHFFKLNVSANDQIPQSSDMAAQATANDLAKEIDASHSSPTQNIRVESARKAFFKKHYNTTLALVRFVANSATVSVGLIVGKHIPMESALMIGMLAGGISAAIQLKSDAVFKWLSNSVLLVNTAKKLGLLKSFPADDPGKAERLLKEAEMYGRWASIEASFLMVCETAMMLLDIPVAENLLLTVAKSTGSQGIYEVGILKTTRELERMNPELAGRREAFKNIALFAGSGVSVLSAVGALIGMPYANLGFLVLTSTGVVLNFGPKLLRTKPVEQILRIWRPRKAVRCEMLLA